MHRGEARLSESWLWMTAAELGRGIGAGVIDPRDLTEVYLGAVAAHPEAARIYARTMPGRARAEAPREGPGQGEVAEARGQAGGDGGGEEQEHRRVGEGLRVEDRHVDEEADEERAELDRYADAGVRAFLAAYQRP